jgi:hypothetical protein
MTVLTACQSAAVRLVGRSPSQFIGSTETFELEISNLIQDVATDIAKATDWQALTILKEQAGDGSTVAFPLPTDFDRLPVGAQIHSETWQRGRYQPANDVNQWLDIITTLSIGAPGYWILLGGELNIFPAMESTETAKYYYISKNIWTASDASTKAAATADTDTFKLDERLLTLGLIWRWRAMKKMDYAEDLSNYERALSERVGRQKGRQVMAMGAGRRIDTSVYPGTILG